MDPDNYSQVFTTEAQFDQTRGTVTVGRATAFSIALAALFGALSFFGAVGNLLTILAVVTNRQLRSQTSSYLILNLAVADMVVFVVIEPFLSLSAATSSWPFSIPLCGAIGALVIQHIMVSVSSMAAIAVNRYFSVVRHRIYPKVFTHRSTIILCLITWLPGLAVLLPVVLTSSIADYSSYYGVCILVSSNSAVSRTVSLLTAATITVSVIASSLCYLQIYRTVRESHRRVKPKELPAIGDAAAAAGGGIVKVQPANKNLSRPENMKKTCAELSAKLPRAASLKFSQICRAEVTIAFNLFVVFAVFCICWTPLTVLIFIKNIDRPPQSLTGEVEWLPGWLWQLSYKMVLFNSTLNIFIYCWRNRNFRSAYLKVLKCGR